MNILEYAVIKKKLGGSGGGAIMECFGSPVDKHYPILGIRNLAIRLVDVTRVGEEAFCPCEELVYVDLPLAQYIGRSSFEGCRKLKKVDAVSAISIGESAFINCRALTEVNLPNATNIGGDAFNGCTVLTKIDLPMATNIGVGAFFLCTNLEALILRTTETVCAIDPIAFVLDTDDDGMPTQFLNVYVPTSMFEYYREAYEPAFEEYGFAGYFDVLFHKIEEHPEICG